MSDKIWEYFKKSEQKAKITCRICGKSFSLRAILALLYKHLKATHIKQYYAVSRSVEQRKADTYRAIVEWLDARGLDIDSIQGPEFKKLMKKIPVFNKAEFSVTDTENELNRSRGTLSVSNTSTAGTSPEPNTSTAGTSSEPNTSTAGTSFEFNISSAGTSFESNTSSVESTEGSTN